MLTFLYYKINVIFIKLEKNKINIGDNNEKKINKYRAK